MVSIDTTSLPLKTQLTHSDPLAVATNFCKIDPKEHFHGLVKALHAAVAIIAATQRRRLLTESQGAMAELIDVCLFPPVTMDTCLEDTLAHDDFLSLLQDSDLTGALPLIPDVCQEAVQAGPVDYSYRSVSDQGAMLTMPPPNKSTPGYATSASGTQHRPSGTLGTEVGLLCSSNMLQPQLLVPLRAVSSSSSDISAAAAGLVAGSAPTSPISSTPTSSSGTPGQSGADVRCSRGLDSRSQRQSSTGAATASQQSQLQPQKPLTKQQIAANKRKAPEIDWRSIEDPAERRRQRRLAKNRVTAARSRERKKEQMAEMEERMATLEQENSQMRALLLSMAQENSSLKEQLASLTRGASTANNPMSSPEPAALKCLAIVHLVYCLLVVRVSFMLVAALVSVLTQQVASGVISAAAAASSSCNLAAHSAMNQRRLPVLVRAVDSLGSSPRRAQLCCVSCGA